MKDGRLTAMRDLLRPLHLYRLDGTTFVDAELAAYAAAFSLLEEMLEDVKAGAFIQTAEGDALAAFERMVGLPPRPNVELETRRSLVLYRLAVAPHDFRLAGMENSAKAAGMDATIYENPPGESLSIRCNALVDDTMEMDSVKARLETMLPAHLRIDFDVGVLTWDMFDAANPSWDTWDAANFSWERFDIDGHNIFTEGE